MRAFALAALVVTMVTVTACGGGDDEAEIRTAIRDLQTSFAARDFVGVCDSMTEAARRHIGSLGHEPIDPCERNMRMVARMAEKGAAGAPVPRRRIGRIEVDGDQATATVRFEDGATGHVPLSKEDGEWKVNALFGDIPAQSQEDNFR